MQQVRSSLTVISMAAMKQPHPVAERLDLLLKVCAMCPLCPLFIVPPHHPSACSSILSLLSPQNSIQQQHSVLCLHHKPAYSSSTCCVCQHPRLCGSCAFHFLEHLFKWFLVGLHSKLEMIYQGCTAQHSTQQVMCASLSCLPCNLLPSELEKLTTGIMHA